MAHTRNHSQQPFLLGLSLSYLFSLLILVASKAFALSPDEILVVANRNYRGSIEVARYYVARRHIPPSNMVRLWTVRQEAISRARFNKDILRPIRREISRRNGKIKCILLTYGIPLKIVHSAPKKRRHPLVRPKSRHETVKKGKKGATADASVDSELSLCMSGNYTLEGWQPNPFFIALSPKTRAEVKFPKNVIMVSRIDGPTVEIAKRIVDLAIKAEQEGLKGIAYFDARYLPPKGKKHFKDMGYGYYDWSIYAASEIVRVSRLFKVIVDSKPTLFKEGSCPRAALYCGWYSLGHYVDAFSWVAGAIGYHIASSELTTLKAKNSQVWCKRMLEDGITVTLGPVREPYIQAFPIPHIFFGLLVNTNLTVAECYWQSIPVTSWQMVLIGDPLYRPFLARTKNIH